MRVGFATTNRGKFESASAVLSKFGIGTEWLKIGMDEPRKGLDEIARAKLGQAVDYVRSSGMVMDAVFVVDSGAYISGLEWPGAFTNFELSTLGMKRILGLAEMEGNDSLEFRNVLMLRMLGTGEEVKLESIHRGRLATTDYEEFLRLEKEAERYRHKAWSPFNYIWIPEGFGKPWFMLSENERDILRKRDGSVFEKLGAFLSGRMGRGPANQERE